MKLFLSLHTVRKKILTASKAVGVCLVVSYGISNKLPFSEDVRFAVWILFVALLACITDRLLKHFISDPVSEICEAAKRIAVLDFSKPCHITSRDEFGSLSDSLAKMSENLQQTLASLEEANIQLAQDVQRKQKLLNERKELADHLSHEMKTPLGVIRAYAEGLQEEPDERKKRTYADIIIAETERMSSIITVLLDLSALEHGAAPLLAERFDFVELLETVAGRLLIDLDDTNSLFTLHYELPEHPVYVCADKHRMEQALSNLIVNAKKNVRTHGRIRLSLTEHDNILQASVFNEGNPIPQETLSKIWEPFYRDKNAKYSGSGLGLAIVAQIFSMQQIAYGVNNTPDGVEFFCSMPII